MAGSFPILYIAEAEPEAAILSSGALAHLVETVPQADFTIVGSSDTAPLFVDTPRLTRTLVLPREGRLEWITLWNQLRDTRWGLIVDMRGSNIASRLRRVKRAVRGEPTPGLHAVEEAAKVLQLETVPHPRVFVSNSARVAADALVRPDDRPILAIGPGADWIGKRWPAERYVKLFSALLGPSGALAGGRLMIVGNQVDRESAQTIRSALTRSRLLELQGQLTAQQAVIALSHATLYVGSDSVWTQLAVASGVPTIGVYGPSDETRVGPWQGVSVRGPRTIAEYRRIDPKLNQAIEHMMDLPAERVIKAANRLLTASRVPS